MNKCEHVVGSWRDGCGASGVAEEDLKGNIDFSDEIEVWFKFCPKCGEQIKEEYKE